MTVRYYSSTAGKMTLIGAITNSSTSLVVDTVVGLPGSTPFTIIIEPGTNAEEICEVTAIGGTTLTITRGIDGTTAQSHNSGVEVRHGISARDLADSRAHENSTAGAHGTSGNVVGTTSAQTLTNKSMDGTANTFTNIPKSAIPNTTAYTTDVQTLTNKTMDGGANTFTNIPKSAIPATTAYTDANNIFNGNQTMQSSAAAGVPLTAKGASGQTGDLQQWQDNTGAVKARVDSAGGIHAPSVASTANPLVNFTQTPVFAKTSTATGFTNTTTTQLSAPAITANGSQTFKITVTWFGVISSVSGDFIDMSIYSNGSQVDAVRCYVASSATHSSGGTCVGYDTPAAGSVTYSLRSTRAFGSGNCGIYASASTPMVIVVEQIG